MFNHIEGILIALLVLAVVVVLAAFAAEGRGERLLRLARGEEPRGPLREHLYDELDRPADSLDVVGRLGSVDRHELTHAGR